MKKNMLTIFFCLLSLFCLHCCIPGSLLNATTWHIKQDGTGNFTTIQEGIDASVDNDTILVYPGIYIENVVIEEKNITLGSLYLTTQADSLIHQTIINGNQEGSCIEIESVNNGTICGFSITNGSGFYTYGDMYKGGGLYINNSQISLKSCFICENSAHYGGGIYLWESYVNLFSTNVHNNYAVYGGGGIKLTMYSEITFDENELNNIYLNYSAIGSDFNKSTSPVFTDIIVDTFTVINPDDFYIIPIDEVSYSIQQSKIQQINADMFIAPYGNDENSGLSPDEPLQTIAWAETIITSDSLNPKTIHLADGEYSPSLNNQRFPINIKNYVNISGESKENTILNAEEETPFIRTGIGNRFFNISKLTLINGYCSNYAGSIFLYSHYNHNYVSLYDIRITNSQNDYASVLYFGEGDYYFKNVSIIDNTGGKAVLISTGDYPSSSPTLNVVFENCNINRNLPDNQPDWGFGGGLRVMGHYEEPGDYICEFINTEITENYNNIYEQGAGGVSGLTLFHDIQTRLVNCTIGNNITENSAGTTVKLYNGAEANFINSIYYGNEGHGMTVGDSCYVSFTNSLYEGGVDNINLYGTAVVEWFEVNITDEDPMWQGEGAEWPYSFLSGSPCIDAGTPDTTGLNLPEFDLAGNPRIYNGIIDMGAYEWQGVGIDNCQLSIVDFQLINYPNPFKPSTSGRNSGTTISFNLTQPGNMKLEIFNTKGQKVKTLMDAYSSRGHFEIIWNGKDENNKRVSSGHYFAKLKVNNETKAVRKLIMLK
jgi:hypothetical protein